MLSRSRRSEILDAPEFVLQIGFGRFVRGFIADFILQAVAAGDFHGRMLAVAAQD